jgi:hypothetical protein
MYMYAFVLSFKGNYMIIVCMYVCAPSAAKASVAKKLPVQNPSGDDFFANFGV